MSSRCGLIRSTTVAFGSIFLNGCLECSPNDAGFAKDCNKSSNKCYTAGTEDDSEAFCQKICTVPPSSQFSGFHECTSCQLNTVYGIECYHETPGSGIFECQGLLEIIPGGDFFTCTQKDCGVGYNKTRDCTRKSALPQDITWASRSCMVRGKLFMWGILVILNIINESEKWKVP